MISTTISHHVTPCPPDKCATWLRYAPTNRTNHNTSGKAIRRSLKGHCKLFIRRIVNFSFSERAVSQGRSLNFGGLG